MDKNKALVTTTEQFREVFFDGANPVDLEWTFITIDPPKAGDAGGRHLFSDDGTVIGYETWIWQGADDE